MFPFVTEKESGKKGGGEGTCCENQFAAVGLLVNLLSHDERYRCIVLQRVDLEKASILFREYMPFPPCLHRSLDWEHVKLLKQVGQGATAKVYEAQIKGKTFAVKRFEVDELFDWNQNDREMSLTGLFHHPNILCTEFACRTPPAFFGSFCSGGNLGQMIHNYQNLYNLTFVCLGACDILKGINYLHQHNVAHLDIKPQNILVHESFRLVLCDFGEARYISCLENKELHGTYVYAPPEVLIGKEKVNEKADIYSFGIVLWELIHRQFPFKKTRNLKAHVRNVVQNRERPVINPLLTPIPFCPVLENAWHHTPGSRASSESLLFQIENNVLSYFELKENGVVRSYSDGCAVGQRKKIKVERPGPTPIQTHRARPTPNEPPPSVRLLSKIYENAKKPIIQVDRFRFMESQLYIHDLHMKEGDGLRAVAPTPPAALSVFSQVDWMKGEGVYN